MARPNWSIAYGIGGLFEHFLDVLLSFIKGGKSSSEPRHCGEFDSLTRKFPVLSTRRDGKKLRIVSHATQMKCGCD